MLAHRVDAVDTGDPREGPLPLVRQTSPQFWQLVIHVTCALGSSSPRQASAQGGACASALVDAVDGADQRALVDGGWARMGSDEFVDLGRSFGWSPSMDGSHGPNR